VIRRTVLTAVGADRSGLVEEVSEFLFERGCSIEDSRMANLQGQFAMVMLVAGPEEAIEKVSAEVDALASGTGIHARLTPVAEATTPTAASVPCRFAGSALDQPGLVHRVAEVFRHFDANIETMETTLGAAPITGAPLFEMTAVVAIPASVSMQALRDELGRVCDAINVDWELAPL
jgi:glycine cleavage system transcriptional repressor